MKKETTKSKPKTVVRQRAKGCHRPSCCSRAASKSYAFVNNKGQVKWFDGETTIPELLAAGVRRIDFVPVGEPMPTNPNVFVHTSPENDPAMPTASDGRPQT